MMGFTSFSPSYEANSFPFVILSAAKDLAWARGQILRCAQDDMNQKPPGAVFMAPRPWLSPGQNYLWRGSGPGAYGGGRRRGFTVRRLTYSEARLEALFHSGENLKQESYLAILCTAFEGVMHLSRTILDTAYWG